MSLPEDRSIPSAAEYLRRLGLLGEGTADGVLAIRCPLHLDDDGTSPTMRVRLDDGSFVCSLCGARGNGIVALHRLATGMDRSAARRDLQGGQA